MNRIRTAAIAIVGIVLLGTGCGASSKDTWTTVTIASARWFQNGTAPDTIEQKVRINDTAYDAVAVESHTLAIGDIWYEAQVPRRDLQQGNYQAMPIGIMPDYDLPYTSFEDGRAVEAVTQGGTSYLCQDRDTHTFNFSMELETNDGPLTLVADNTNCTNVGQSNSVVQ